MGTDRRCVRENLILLAQPFVELQDRSNISTPNPYVLASVPSKCKDSRNRKKVSEPENSRYGKSQI